MTTHHKSGRVIPGGIRLYRLLLWAYPATFRRHYEASLLQLMTDLWRREQGQGPRAQLRLWRRLLLDLALSASLEHWYEWRKSMARREAYWLALAALFLIVPLVFLAAVFVEQVVGNPFLMNALYPSAQTPLARHLKDMIIVLGPPATMAFSVLSLVRIQIDPSHETFITVGIQKGHLAHLLLLGVGLAMTLLFASYFLMENFQCIVGRQLTC